MTPDLFSRLAEPFPPEAISWRVGSTNIDKQTNQPRNGAEPRGLALAYLDTRDVMDRLDLVCGPAGWQNRYSHVGGITVCEISILAGDTWITKADGAGATDVEAEKGACSDAFKRSAVRFGVGRYLYSLSSPWVALKPQGRSWVIADSEYGKLRALLANHSGVTLKSAAQAKRDKDFEFFKAKIDDADDLEALGAVGREIKEGIALLPASQRDPLHDAYALRLEELKGQGIVQDRPALAREPGDTVPTPDGDFPPDWEAWRKIIAAKINKARDPLEIGKVREANRAGLAECAKVLSDTGKRIEALIAARLDKLAEPKAA